MTRLDNARRIRAPRGPEITARSWLTEAAMRMLMNNLDPEVAERPQELVVYGGIGRAARDWASFDRIVAALRRLEADQTLLVQSGKPVGVFRTHPDAPRVLIANSNLVPHWANWEHFNALDRRGLMMYVYRLTGHKWFTSAPMCDIFLVLAQAPGGLSCFFLPRVLPDGSLNRMRLQRLKDKLGNNANASSEVEYDGATAWLVGEEGRGVPTIIEMVNLTRLDCTLGSATSMRTGLTQAVHHAQHRKAFGEYLIDQPLMRNVLADLAVEAEAATMVAMRMAGATDNAVRGDDTEALLRRIGLAASKYWVCKRATPHAAEAMECLGGNGYVEESGMPRLYREAPLMGIWEGSGNVSALDTLRAMATRPECIDVLFSELAKSTGQDVRLDRHIERLRPQLGELETIQYRARKVAEDICLALQGSLLVRHGHPAVAEAFLATRLEGQWGGAFGTMPAGLDLAPIIERALVKG